MESWLVHLAVWLLLLLNLAVAAWLFLDWLRGSMAYALWQGCVVGTMFGLAGRLANFFTFEAGPAAALVLGATVLSQTATYVLAVYCFTRWRRPRGNRSGQRRLFRYNKKASTHLLHLFVLFIASPTLCALSLWFWVNVIPQGNPSGNLPLLVVNLLLTVSALTTCISITIRATASRQQRTV